jgi:anti-sigma factor RsiW
MTMLEPHLDVDQLSAAVDGDQDAAVSAHLLTCLACREQVTTWQRSLGQLEALATAPAPGSADETVEVAMMAWRRPVRDRRHHHLGSIAAAVAAAVVIAGGIIGLAHLAGSGSASTSSASSGGPSRATVPGAVASAGASGTSGSSATSRKSASGGSGGTASAPHASSTSSGLVAADGAALVADLRRDVRRGSIPAPVPASTPCLGTARSIEGGGAASAPTKASFETPVELAGVDGRVFLFRRGGGYVALVLHDRSCSLVATLSV